ncbi:hypothetical protein L1280_000473 [Deinococcus sp. HSC-46F16]|uniref:hypothetical protein n=1 Tax=Deinococcus sp. HSC-46F16 TaxID=2910968 RepID=UPI00209FB072|nr:hypothetical protein [Deinococcus sp. HSC-46F16]MCP2013345.1 hypothetical protein [Deinococcus sp. HSC-46F16]
MNPFAPPCASCSARAWGSGRAWLGGPPDAPYTLAQRLLDAAHDAALEGLGRRGEHPGEWATASADAAVGATGLRLVLRQGEREVAPDLVPTQEEGGSP